MVKREADRIEQGRFAGTGRAGNGEQPVIDKWGASEVDGPFAFERIEILKCDFEDFHRASSSCTALST